MANIVGRVAVLEGKAVALAKDGSQRVLKVGDPVYEGEVVISGPHSHVELAFDNGHTYLVPEKETVTLDSTVFGGHLPDAHDAALQGGADQTAQIARAIAQGNSLDDLLDETAAGLTGGPGNDGHTFVQLLRIVEVVSPLAFGQGGEHLGVAVELGTGGGFPSVPLTSPSTTVSTTAGSSTTTAPAPTVAITTDANNDGYISKAEQGEASTEAVSVGLPAGAVVGDTINLTDGTTPQTHVLTAADIAAHAWTTTVAKPAEGATLTVTATFTDALGNVSAPASDSAVLDTAAPAPTLTITTDTNNDGYISRAEQGNATTEAVSVGLPAGVVVGDTINLSDGITPQTHVLTAADIAAHAWTTTVAKPAEGAVLTVTATITDALGNVSAPASDSAVLDTTATASIAITGIAGDDIVSGAEAAGTVSIVGTVGGDAKAGDIVSTTINGTAYTGTVAADNTHFTIADVSGGDLTAAAGTPVTVSLTAHDAIGNAITVTDSHGYSVQTTATASIAITGIAGDDIVSGAEAAGTVSIVGTVGGDAKAGDIVSTTINGTAYTGTVAADNTHFTIADVSGGDLTAAAGTPVTVSLTAHDAIGNAITVTDSHGYSVQTTATASIAITGIAGDDIVSGAEAAGTVSIVGTVGGDAKAGDIVSTTINGTAYTGTVAADNTHFTIADVSGGDLTAAAGTPVTVSLTAHDAIGNAITVTDSHGYSVQTTATASIAITGIAGDDIVSGAEAAGTVSIVGTVGGDAKAGDIVSTTINGTAYTGTVAADNTHFTIADVSGGDLTAAAGTPVTVSLTAHDAIGNAITVTDSHGYSVQTTATASIAITGIAGDDIVSGAEAAGTVSIVGTVGGDAKAGDIVSTTINGTAYTGTVAADNTHFTIADVSGGDLTAAAGTPVTVSLTAHDAIGNAITVTDSHGYSVQTTATASIAITGIAGDDIVSGAEAAGTVSIVGTVGGDAKAGDIVSTTINGTAYTGTVAADNTHFTIADVSGGDLTAAAGTPVTVSLTAHDAIGNAITVTDSHGYSVQTTATASIAITGIAGDDIVSGAEAAGTVSIVGTVGGDAKAGDIVSTTINGTAYTGTVAADNTHFTIADVSGGDLTAAAGTPVTVSLTAHDAIGNAITVTDSHGYTVDTAAAAAITVDHVAGDNIVNAAESGSLTVPVTGIVSGDAKVGDTVTLTVNGHAYTGQVQPGNTYSINVSGADLLADADHKVDASVTATDAAGNSVTVTAQGAYTVDTSAAAGITVDHVAGDNIVNAAESGSLTVPVTGIVSGDAKVGDTVTLTVNGHAYTGQVQSGNSYSINVSGADLLADADHKVDASVTATDAAGNSITVTAQGAYTVDTSAAAGITVDHVAGDNIVNAAESGSLTVPVTGIVSGDAKVGDTVTLTVNGHAYTGQVQSGNSYSINVSGADLLADADHKVDASVTATDAAGNSITVTAQGAYTVDTAAAAGITVDHVAGDNIVNAAESGSLTVPVTGIVSGDAKVGDTVTLTVNGHAYTGQVQSGNSYSINVSGADLLADADHKVDASVTATDAAGNSVTVTAQGAYTVDTSAAAAITVDHVAGDNIVNAAESGSLTVPVTGIVSGDAKVGDTVTLTVNGHAYTGQVQSGNSYSINVSGADLLADADHKVDASVTATDAAGNSVTVTAQGAYTVDTSAAAAITVDHVAGDNIVNAAESGSLTVPVTGIVSGDAKVGDTVTLTVNGHAYTGQVQSGNSYSINVSGADLLADADHKVDASVTATDAAGNSVTVTAQGAYTVDTSAAAAITVDHVAGDNIVNAAESGSLTVPVTGIVSGDAKVGDTVTLTVNGHAYTGQVQSGNSYSINVSGADLLADADHKVDASVTATDAAGNSVTVTAQGAYTVDTSAAAAITVDHVAGDNIVNAAESGSLTVPVTGIVSGDAKVGDTVTLTVNGHAYTGQVQSGNSYSINVSGADLLADADHKVDASVTATDAAGNSVTVTAQGAYTVDTSAAAGITVDHVAGDNIVNAAESGSLTVPVTGIVSGDAKVGDTVTLTVNGHAYTGQVQSGNSYSINVSGADLLADADHKVDASVTATDAAGNSITVTAQGAYTVDTSAAAAITVDHVAGDNIVNAAESGSLTVPVTGIVSGDAKVGDTVTLTVNGHAYTGQVQSGNSYSINVSGADLLADADHKVDASVTATDAAGNSITVTAQGAYTVDTSAAAAITVDHVAGDNIVNAAESGSLTVPVTGIVSGDAKVGDTVTLTVNGHAYTGQVQSGNSYSINVSGADLLADADHKVDASVTATDAAGNSITVTAQGAYTVDTSAAAGITVNHVAGDNIVNAAESGSLTVPVTGIVSGDAKVGDTVTLTVNGHAYTGQVQSGNSYSINVSGADLLADADHKVDASVTATDAAGNSVTVTAQGAYTVDTSAAAGITVDHVAGDNIVNAAESGSLTVPVTGIVSGDAKVGDTVTLTVNGHAYTGQVQSGNSYSINVSGADLLADADHKVDASVTATDAAGNSVTVTAQGAYTVDTSAAAGITVDHVAGDNIVNAAESGSLTVPVTGIVSGDAKVGDTVTLTVNGHAYTGQVQSGNSYSINVSGADLLADADHKVDASVTATDAAGNSITVTAQGAYTVDTSAAAGITVDHVAGDNIVNAAESGSLTVPVTGIVSGDAKVGDTVTLTVNGHAYTGQVQSGNSYSINVSGADLLADADHKVDASVTATDAAGNSITVTAQGAYTVDTAAPGAPALSASTSVGAISGLFNTGVNATGNAIAAGTADSHYTLVSEPSGATFSTAVAVSQSAANAVNWSTADYATSEWIGATATNPKSGTFVYQTSFTITGGVDLRSVDVQFDINADDNVTIDVNGHSTGISLLALWTAGSVQHVDLSGVSGLFALGTNTITFNVTNTGAGPTGLKIDNMSVTALSSDAMPVTVDLTATGATAGDTLTFTANDGTTATTTSHVLTAAEVVAHSVVEHETVPTGNSVSTYTATLTDVAGNTSTLATETVFGSGNHSVAAAAVGADVFKWTLDSHGVAGTPATDAITGYNNSSDALDLRDLLVGENHNTGIGNLANYINISTSTSGGVTSTEIHISHSGGFTNGTYSAGAEDQHVTLTGVNLFTTYGDSTSTALIQHLLNNGKLVTD